MPARPSLALTHREFTSQASRLRSLCTHVPVFNPDYRVLLAEMIALQAFYFFELAIEDIAAKLVCGASYCDGSAAVITDTARSIDDALVDMRTVGRPRAKGILKWNKTGEITDNVRHVMAPTDNFCVACRNHSARLDEIRIVRNHIAHNNKGTKREFSLIVQRRLGAMPQRIPRAGAFVLREFTPGISLLVEFVATLTVVIKDAAKC